MKRIKSNAGFTIIELLISTVIFSLVLLVITGAIIQYGRIYYKGVTASQTQAVTRTVISSIEQDIQFGGSATEVNYVNPATNPPGQHSIQVGNRCYTYLFNKQINSTNDRALAYRDGSCASTGTDIEMLSTNMQLVALSIQKTGNLYSIVVRVAYGADSDMVLPAKKQCKTIRIGGQFCYVSELRTTVAKRVNGA